MKIAADSIRTPTCVSLRLVMFAAVFVLSQIRCCGVTTKDLYHYYPYNKLTFPQNNSIIHVQYTTDSKEEHCTCLYHLIIQTRV